MSVGTPTPTAGVPTPFPDYNQMLAQHTPAAPAAPAAPVVNTPNAPSGGATLPPQPAPQGLAGAGGPQTPATAPTPSNNLVLEYERQNRVPVGRFKTDAELLNAVYSLAEQVSNEADELRQARMGQTPPATPAAPQTPAAPAAPEPSALSQIATVFQQNGMLQFQNGQWVSTHPASAETATHLNRQAAEVQARQAELADPKSFIGKYGKDVFKQELTPLEQKLQEMESRYAALEQRLAAAVPKPHMTWVEQNKSVLFKEGTQEPSDIGKVYAQAWDTAAQSGVTDEAACHQLALMAVTPYMTQRPATPQPAAPQTPWINQALQTQQVDPSFGMPGTVSSRPSDGIGLPLMNDGFPDYHAMLNQGQPG